MIKSATNKPDFFAEVRRLAAETNADPVRLALVGAAVKLCLDKDGAEVEHLLVRGRTSYGAMATFKKWSRWMEELLSQLAEEQAKRQRSAAHCRRLAEDRPAPADVMTQAEIEQWAAARLGWSVFFLTAWREGDEVTSGAKPWANIAGAGIDGHIFVEVGEAKRSIPLHMVINSAAKLGAMSCPVSEGAAKGAPAMCYAVFSPDTPDSVVNDQLEMFETQLRVKIKELLRQAVAEALAGVRELAAPITRSVPTPSLLCYPGEGPHFPEGMEPGPVAHPASGALSSTRYTYTAPLEGWQDQDTVRRQRDLLAWCVLELITCADPNRDACEIRRARDLVGQVRHLGSPV